MVIQAVYLLAFEVDTLDPEEAFHVGIAAVDIPILSDFIFEFAEESS
jgi:hypothetical protein